MVGELRSRPESRLRIPGRYILDSGGRQFARCGENNGEFDIPPSVEADALADTDADCVVGGDGGVPGPDELNDAARLRPRTKSTTLVTGLRFLSFNPFASWMST